MGLRRRRRRTPRLTCADVVELVTDYLEGALPDDVATRVSEHLEHCYGCARYVEQIRQTSAALRRVELSGLSEDACNDLLAAFRDWDGPRPGAS
jgi:anti-sigma factor RsiW